MKEVNYIIETDPKYDIFMAAIPKICKIKKITNNKKKKCLIISYSIK